MEFSLKEFSLFVLAFSIVGFNMYYSQSTVIGFFAFVLYTCSFAKATSRHFSSFEDWLRPFFSLLFLFDLLLLLTASLVFMRTSLSNNILLAVITIPSFLFFHRKTEKKSDLSSSLSKSELLVAIVPLILLSVVSYLLWSVRTGETVMSARELFPSSLYPILFLTSFCISLLLFTKYRARIRLSIIVLFSAIFCSYPYVVYEYMYGSDLWIYLATSRWLASGLILPLGSTLMKTLMQGTNFHIGLHSLNIVVSTILQIDLYWVVLLFGALLLSVFIPLLMYQIGKKIFNNTTYAFVLSFLPSFLYDTVVWRSLSSANGLGLLMCLFALLFWISWLLEARIPLPFLALVTGCAVFAYPMTGLYAVILGALSIFIKKYGTKISLKTVLFILSVSFVVPILSLVSPITTLASIRPWDEVLKRLIYASERSSSLDPLLNLSYIFIYILTLYGLLKARKKIRSEIYMLLSVSLLIITANAVFMDLANIQTLRITTTILPYFFIFFAGIGIKTLVENSKGAKFKLRYRFRPLTNTFQTIPLKMSVIAIAFILAIGSTAIYFFMPYMGPNPSEGQMEAVKYVLEQDENHSSLILTDTISEAILRAEASGSWYGLNIYETQTIADYALPMYITLLKNSSFQSLIDEKNRLTGVLAEASMSINPIHCFIVYDTTISELYGFSPEKTLLELEAVFGTPKVFGDTFVYSTYIPKNMDNGLILQLTEDVFRYDMVFSDLESLLSKSTVEGQFTYGDSYGGFLAFSQNSSLVMEIDAKYEIINASLSCSIYQYEEYNRNLIQVSIDGLNWITMWKANLTRSYDDLTNLELSSILGGHTKFYLRFCSENVNDTSAYSMAIRNSWGNKSNGIALKIYTYPP